MLTINFHEEDCDMLPVTFGLCLILVRCNNTKTYHWQQFGVERYYFVVDSPSNEWSIANSSTHHQARAGIN